MSTSCRILKILTAIPLIALAGSFVATLSGFEKYSHSYSTPGISADEPRVRSLINEAAKLREEGKYDTAAPLLNDALTIVEQTPGTNDSLQAATLNQIGMLDKYAGRFDEGEEMYERALTIVEKGETSYSLQLLKADLYHNLGGLYHAREQYADGEPFARRAVEIRAKLLGPDHPDTIADKAALAALLEGQRKFSEAEGIYLEAVKVFEREDGPYSYDVAINLNNLAALYFEQSKFDESERLYRRTLAIKEKLLGPQHPDVGTTLNNLAVLYKSQKRFHDAETLYLRALAILEKSLDPAHPKLLECRANYAEIVKKIAERRIGSKTTDLGKNSSR